MNRVPILSLPDMPLCVGACSTPSNPQPLPDVYPIDLWLNMSLGRLELSTTPEFDDILQTAYGFGLEMGTPSDDTDLGRPYVIDFLRFIEESTATRGKALEVGAGVGYLSALLRDQGWKIQSIEPGSGYQGHWEKHGVDVINDFFPSPQATGPYDLIVFYTVLEHMQDTRAFLRIAAKHLSPEGKIVLSVPDCTAELEAGDPSMLLHEHYQYFTQSSLRRTLADAGLDSHVTASAFGRSLYACATPSSRMQYVAPSQQELEKLASYAIKVNELRDCFHAALEQSFAYGTVGIYCPARCLTLLRHDSHVRFFDDSPTLEGKFYPPFSAPIESRDDLLSKPTDTLMIMSRTFGDRLAKELSPQLPATRILEISTGFVDNTHARCDAIVPV